MSVTAAMVKELRDSTGAGMMDAKKALTENNGDMEASVDWLRTKGLAKAAKKSDVCSASSQPFCHNWRCEPGSLADIVVPVLFDNIGPVIIFYSLLHFAKVIIFKYKV